MAHTPEPQETGAALSESVFEEALLVEAESILRDLLRRGAISEWAALTYFGLDLAFVVSNQRGDRTRFLEVKSYYDGKRNGGVGFGTGQGNGSQVNMLLLDEGQRKALDTTVRWVISDGRGAPRSRRYALLTNAQARSAAMGGVAHGKQNNLRMTNVMEASLDWDQLSKALESFFLN